jgi:hypothetical protein
MKLRELDRRVKQAGAEFLYQDGSSHRYYKFNGVEILKIIKGAK